MELAFVSSTELNRKTTLYSTKTMKGEFKQLLSNDYDAKVDS